MTHTFGTDEAGYGPNIGPLVIVATRWIAPPSPRPILGDSKRLYHSGGSLARLEAACLGGLTRLGHAITSYRQFCDVVMGQRETPPPFWEDRDLAIPCAATPRAIDDAAAALTDLAGIHGRLVFPAEFNHALGPQTNKSDLLSQTTLTLVAAHLPPSPQEAVFVRCDKHGGRNTYADLLRTHIAPGAWEMLVESRGKSEYRLGRLAFAFCAKGESFPEVALASLVAKYCRELSMRLFNAFWQSHMGDLAPTAGYPVDAARFRRAIAATQRRLHIPDADWWRVR